MDKNWMVLLQKNTPQRIVETNKKTKRFGLALSEADAELILEERSRVLREQKRVEFGTGIVERIIYEFCDSDFIHQDNYVETILRLQEIFFLYKNEMLDEITDEELLHFMREQFETICFGDLDYLEGTCLNIFAQAIRAGYQGFKASEGYGEYGKFDEVPRWDYGLYLAALSALLGGVRRMDFAFTMEELVPVVARLTEQYTSFDSTSVSYEKAEQLMGAVLYCIQENAFAPQKASGQAGGTAEREDSKQAEDIAEHRLVSGREAVTAQQAYEMGLLLVKEKAERSLVMYNQMRSELVYYGNMYLHDIFEKELPEFFIRYDVRFEPQDTILMLDYPVLKDLSGYSGIDKIYEFMRCIQMEQAFLRKLPEDFCQAVFFQDNPIILSEGNNLCGSDNLCEAVLIAALGHILAEKPMREHVFDEADYMRIRKAILEEKGEKIKEAVEKALEGFIHGCCGEEKGLSEYLSGAMDAIAVRVGIGVEHLLT